MGSWGDGGAKTLVLMVVAVSSAVGLVACRRAPVAPPVTAGDVDQTEPGGARGASGETAGSTDRGVRLAPPLLIEGTGIRVALPLGTFQLPHSIAFRNVRHGLMASFFQIATPKGDVKTGVDAFLARYSAQKVVPVRRHRADGGEEIIVYREEELGVQIERALIMPRASAFVQVVMRSQADLRIARAVADSMDLDPTVEIDAGAVLGVDLDTPPGFERVAPQSFALMMRAPAESPERQRLAPGLVIMFLPKNRGSFSELRDGFAHAVVGKLGLTAPDLPWARIPVNELDGFEATVDGTREGQAVTAYLAAFEVPSGAFVAEGSVGREWKGTSIDTLRNAMRSFRLRDGIPPATPGLELDSEDYAVARRKFRTTLLRKGASPQRADSEMAPPDVTVVTYRSGDLDLKAWVGVPKDKAEKMPAVLFLHGGWAFGDEDWDMARPFIVAGFVTMIPILRGENGQPGSFTFAYDEVDDVVAAAERLSQLPNVDPTRIYIAGHSAGGTLTLLASLASTRFRAAASFSGAPDMSTFLASGWHQNAPFDVDDVREVRMRSAVAFATSFKCPVRISYGAEEEGAFGVASRRTARLAKAHGLDVAVHVVPGDHFTSVAEETQRAIELFRTVR